MLNNPNYVDNAPKAVVDKQKSQLDENIDLEKKLITQMAVIEQV